MRDDDNSSIGEPAPVEGGSMWETLGRFAGLAIAAAGGITIFAVLTTPTHVRGATASSRLRWQQIPACEEPAATIQGASQTNTTSPQRLF